MLIEQTTTYAYKLKYLENPSFDKVRDFAKKFIDELPKELVDGLYSTINRGVDILKTEPEMLVYLYSLGNMHQAKLNFAFAKIPEDFLQQPEINIIDYGCGQAIGTMCYADFLKSKNYNQQIKSVTLIEPSEICLKRAALHVSVCCPNVNLSTVNKKFDELSDMDCSYKTDIPTLHILSNVLDLDFDLQKFAKVIYLNLRYYNQFVCVGPYFYSLKKDRRMNDFANLLRGNIDFSTKLGKGELNTSKNWTCQAIVFSKIQISTCVAYDEIENGIADDFGVVYSKDGKMLLDCRNKKIKKYKIKQGTIIICFRAFENCASLLQIDIPDSVNAIGSETFAGCRSLYRVTIPNSVCSIECRAFAGCNSLTSIVLPNTIKKIESQLFMGCKDLCDIDIPNSVNTIENNAFSNCSSLQKVTIPNSVYDIWEGVFCFCTSLKEVVISNSVTTIEKDVFMNCKSLSRIIIPNSVTTICDRAFLNCTAMKQVIISNSVTTIGESTFFDCKSLQEIYIPDSVIVIKDRAFENCTSLRKIIISNSVVTIGKSVFCNCKSLQEIDIPDSVSKISEHIFENCSSLKRITIPNSVTSIEKFAFYRCRSLREITIPDSIVNIGQSAFDDTLHHISVVGKYIRFEDEMLIDVRNKRLMKYFGNDCNVVVPDSVLTIGSGAFNDKHPQIVYVPNSVTTIEEYAFANSYLQQIRLTNNITSIGANAFARASIIVPEQCIEQYKELLDICLWCRLKIDVPTTISEEEIENGVKDEYGVVYSKNGKKLLVCQNKQIENYEIKFGTECICDSAFLGCKLLQYVSLPDSIDKIGNHAFDTCRSLFRINIPSSTTVIGECAFCNCKSLQYIFIPKSIIEVGRQAFWAYDGLQMIIPEGTLDKFKKILPKRLWSHIFENISLTVATEKELAEGIVDDYECEYSQDGKKFFKCNKFLDLDNYYIKEGTRIICDKAFDNVLADLTVFIPNTVELIGNNVFNSDCIQSICIEADNDFFEVRQGMFIDKKRKKLLRYLEQQECVSIPNDIEIIGDRAFENCSSIRQIIIPDSVVKIGAYAFSKCESLQYIRISNSINVIPFGAFRSCKLLQHIFIPNSVFDIEGYAFALCESLQQITLPYSIKIIRENTFASCRTLRQVYIPDSVENIEDKAFVSCSSLQRIFIPNSVKSICDEVFAGCISLELISLPESVCLGRNIFGQINSCSGDGNFCKSLKHIVIYKNELEILKKMLPHDWWENICFFQ